MKNSITVIGEINQTIWFIKTLCEIYDKTN